MKLAVRMLVPCARAPAGIAMTALPLLNDVAPEEYVPLVNAIEPVGVGAPLPPLTAMVTVTG